MALSATDATIRITRDGSSIAKNAAQGRPSSGAPSVEKAKMRFRGAEPRAAGSTKSVGFRKWVQQAV